MSLRATSLVVLLALCILACACVVSGNTSSEHLRPSAGRSALLVAIPLPGHVNPLLSQAFELRRRGWEVTVASPSRMRAHISSAFAAAAARNDTDAAGVEYMSLGECGDKAELHDALERAADHENFMESAREMFHWALSLHGCIYANLLEQIKLMKHRPTVIVSDFATYAGLDAADMLGIPCVVNNPDLLNMLSPDDVAPYDYVPGTMTATSVAPFNSSATVWGLGWRVIYPPLRVILRWIVESTAGAELAQSQQALGIPSSPRGLLGRFSGRLVLVNNVFGLEYPRPLAPNIVMVGPMLDQKWTALVKTARGQYEKQLSAEDRAWLDLSPGVPVVWVSMGTIAPLNHRQVLEMLTAFSSLARAGTVRVLWKLDAEDHAFLPSDMPPTTQLRVVTWVSSQLGVLAHDATRVFVSHCGINSVHESVYLGTPLLCIPILADQADMAARVQDANCGSHLSKSTFTAESLSDSMLQLLEPANAASMRSSLYRARDSMLLTGGVERACDYIEYVSVHGTSALVPIDVAHPWWVRANLDVLLVHAVLAWLWYKLCFWCCCTMRPGKECVQDRRKIKASNEQQAAARRKAE